MLHWGRKTVPAGGDAREPGPEDLRLIETLAGRAIAPEEVYVRSMVLCTGAYDRDHERFSDEVLAQFAASIPGKSLLVGHRRDSAPEGLFFKAEVRQLVDGVAGVEAWFYVLVTDENEHLRKLMDAGVIRYTSIGFRCEQLRCDVCGRDVYSHECPHIPGRSYDGVVATGTWVGRAEAVEGSLVYLGSQYGAALNKGAGEDQGPGEERLVLTRDLADARAEVKRLLPLAEECLEERGRLGTILGIAGGDAEQGRTIAELQGEIARRAPEIPVPRPLTIMRCGQPDVTPYLVSTRS